MIVRTDYLNEIRKYIDVPLVKILAGVRRSGKSTIFEMVIDELVLKGIKRENIIIRKYSDIEYENMTAKEMYFDIKNNFSNQEKYYIFLDELQEIDGWEKAVNTLLENENVDIYVTGSNSKLMSSEISTYLSGRYILIPVYTLSFKEFILFKNNLNLNKYEMFEEYLKYGGFPIIGISNFDMKSAYQIVGDIYTAVVTNDICNRHEIRNRELFDRVIRFVIENIGKTFSANSIVNFLKNEKRSLSVETIYNYLKWLVDAFIIYPCQRYDIQGKSILKTQEKYYLSDISFKYGLLGFNSKMISSILENIVFLEMKRRGYDVFIGKNNETEIDFIATRKNEKIYVQVCRNIPDNSNRESENLKSIKDHYSKYIVCMDRLAIGNDEGVKIVHIADFLLDEW